MYDLLRAKVLDDEHASQIMTSSCLLTVICTEYKENTKTCGDNTYRYQVNLLPNIHCLLNDMLLPWCNGLRYIYIRSASPLNISAICKDLCS